MKKIYLSILAIVLHLYCSAAGFSITINKPVNSWQPSTAGFISSPEIEVTPRGLYCEVALTFSINANPSSYSTKDSLEGVVEFNLPANSFVHDSWLWLDNNVIIRAAVVERTTATQIYESIVKRRRDPSLLTKTGASSYKLNVYPMTTGYARKVKIVYSVPFEWTGSRFSVPMPIDLFKASSLSYPDFSLKVNSDNTFKTPYFQEPGTMTQISPFTATSYMAIVNPSDYINRTELDVVFNTTINSGVFLGVYPTGTNEGIYQLGINPSLATVPYKPKNIVVIMDHGAGALSPVFSIPFLKQQLKTRLLKHYNEKDSFNIFYMYGGVKSAYTGWHAADSASVCAAINGIPETNPYNAADLQPLLNAAIAFSETKPGTATQSLLISVNTTVYQQTAVTDMVNNIKSHVGGTLTNKIQVINNSSAMIKTGSNTYTASEPLFKALASESKGAAYITTATELKNILSYICYDNGYHTASYKVSIPFNSGFTYGEYEISGRNQFSETISYTETGKFYGSIGTGPVLLDYATNSGIGTVSSTPVSLTPGSDHFAKVWVNKYMIDLLSQNIGLYTKEIVDSSKNNRVLCDSTAFLALETGDTINISKGPMVSGPIILGGVVGTTKALDIARLYPNPFTDLLNIESTDYISGFEVFDMMGRKIYSIQITVPAKNISYNGRTSDGVMLTPGIYTIIVHTASQTGTYKVHKL